MKKIEKKTLTLLNIVLTLTLISNLNGTEENKQFFVNQVPLRQKLNSLKEEHKKNWQNNPDEIAYLSTQTLVNRIKNGEITSLELVWTYYDRIERFNKDINAVVTINFEVAVKKAIAADTAIAEGLPTGKLHGIPFLIKDTFLTKGVRTTAGYKPYENFIPEENAVIVQRLIDEGAILLGKTNTPVLALDMQCSNPVFGTTSNAWDNSRTAGGSSGGGSAALAAGFTPFEIGSDLAGSIRVPAAFNGIYGFRPTHGTTSFRGHIPPKLNETNGLRRMAVAGPLARNVEDLHLIFSIIEGPDSNDTTLIPLQKNDKTKLKTDTIKIAWSTNFNGVPVSKDIKEAIQEYAEILRNNGYSVVNASPKDFPYYDAWETWGEIVGMQGGYENSNFMRSIGSFFAKSSVEPSPMQHKITQPISVEKYMNAWEKQNSYIDHLERFLNEYDVWIVPVSSTLAFKHHKASGSFGDFLIYSDPLKVDGVDVHYYVATQSYTTIFSLTESPVVTIPITVKKGLPVGIQLVGRRFEDYKLLQIAEKLSEHSTMQKYPYQK
jgi:amidase